MITPTIHLNGTSKDEIIAQYEAANVALGAALRTLIDTAPNGRDYYTQGPDALRQAGVEQGPTGARRVDDAVRVQPARRAAGVLKRELG